MRRKHPVWPVAGAHSSPLLHRWPTQARFWLEWGSSTAGVSCPPAKRIVLLIAENQEPLGTLRRDLAPMGTQACRPPEELLRRVIHFLDVNGLPNDVHEMNGGRGAGRSIEDAHLSAFHHVILVAATDGRDPEIGRASCR